MRNSCIVYALSVEAIISAILFHTNLKNGIDISNNFDIIKNMETQEIFKVLANETRLHILQWLKEPEVHFPPQDVDPRSVGVCVSSIQKKTELAQSTVSHYLSMLEATGLVISTRQGQSTYYRRNQEACSHFASVVASEL